MIFSFANAATEDVFNGRDTNLSRKGCPKNLWSIARRKLDQINAASLLDTLRAPPGNRLEALKANRQGQHSIRINDQFRICFRWTDRGAEAVQITDYH